MPGVPACADWLAYLSFPTCLSTDDPLLMIRKGGQDYVRGQQFGITRPFRYRAVDQPRRDPTAGSSRKRRRRCDRDFRFRRAAGDLAAAAWRGAPDCRDHRRRRTDRAAGIFRIRDVHLSLEPAATAAA